jgi:hypothetical protein
MLRKEDASLNIVSIMIIIILAISIAVITSTLTGFGKPDIAQGQEDNNITSSSSSTITPE